MGLGGWFGPPVSTTAAEEEEKDQEGREARHERIRLPDKALRLHGNLVDRRVSNNLNYPPFIKRILASKEIA